MESSISRLLKNMRAEAKMHLIGRLRHALTDSRNHAVAYPTLAMLGLMERTANGFKMIDPEAVNRRINEAIRILES